MEEYLNRKVEKLATIRDIDDICPNCKSDRYLNPNMILVVSDCYHKMCESCVERLFSVGPAPCPECQTTLRKTSFSKILFEDLGVEKEVRIRKRLADIYNKTEEDFNSLREYNDYLEEVEDIVFNLYNGIDVEKTEMKIKDYSKANADIIRHNYKKKQYDDQYFIKEQEAIKRQRLEVKEQYIKERDEETRQKLQNERQFIKDLMNSKGDGVEVTKKSVNLGPKKQIIGFPQKNIRRVDQGYAASFRQVQKLQESIIQDRGIYDPIIKYFQDYPTKSKDHKNYKDPTYKVTKEEILLAKIGGYTSDLTAKKHVDLIHYGILAPLRCKAVEKK